MTDAEFKEILAPEHWYRVGRGPRYQQLHRYLLDQIASGRISENTQLPPERSLAELADVSRVTVRQAISQLVSDGVVEQRRGAGSFVLEQKPRHEQSLSSLVSFSETMRSRGRSAESRVLSRGLYSPSPEEVVTLGLAPGTRVSRIERLRISDGIPMAIEASTLPENILHQPERVTTSLYEVLRSDGRAPARAIQRVNAVNLNSKDAKLLNLVEGTAALRIISIGYLDSGRPIEFTQGLYRSDTYDFVSELRIDPDL